MKDTKRLDPPGRIDQDTENLWRPDAPEPGRVPVTPARGGGARPPADWQKRKHIAGFIDLCLIGATIVVIDLLAARFLLGWHS